MNDSGIVELYWARSEAAIEETSKKYGAYCYTVAYNILSSREDSEEAVNDTYLSAWNSMPPHRPSILSAFLGKLTRRISIDKYRQKTAGKRGGGEVPLALDELEECTAGDDTVESEFDRHALADAINRFVRSLPSAERDVFILRYFNLYPVNMIAARIGFSESRVASMLMRTRKKLREFLEKEGLL